MTHKEAGMQKLATRKQTIKTPFKDVLPPLKSSELEALTADIKANGVLHPVVIDEYGNILDGHHRYAIDHKAPTRVVSGLSPDEKIAYTIRANVARRNLSSEQTREIAKQQKQIAANLREADPKKWTQQAVGALLGVARNTVSDWFITNVGADNTNKTPTPDARVKLNTPAKEVIAVRVESGESQQQIAADFGVSQATVSNIAKKANEAEEKAEARRQSVANRKDVGGLYLGDFRDIGHQIPDASVDLIFTDPPYDRKAIELYDGLGEFAARVLRPGGSLISYVGQIQLPDALADLSAHLRYWWTCSCYHSGPQLLRMNEYGIVNGWKPIVWFVKETRGDKTTFINDVATGSREKSHHEWQQSEEEARYFIELLTEKDGFVVDPFCGGGTTPAACIGLGRKWCAFEIDEANLARASERISEAIK